MFNIVITIAVFLPAVAFSPDGIALLQKFFPKNFAPPAPVFLCNDWKPGVPPRGRGSAATVCGPKHARLSAKPERTNGRQQNEMQRKEMR